MLAESKWSQSPDPPSYHPFTRYPAHALIYTPCGGLSTVFHHLAICNKPPITWPSPSLSLSQQIAPPFPSHTKPKNRNGRVVNALDHGGNLCDVQQTISYQLISPTVWPKVRKPMSRVGPDRWGWLNSECGVDRRTEMTTLEGRRESNGETCGLMPLKRRVQSAWADADILPHTSIWAWESHDRPGQNTQLLRRDQAIAHHIRVDIISQRFPSQGARLTASIGRDLKLGHINLVHILLILRLHVVHGHGRMFQLLTGWQPEPVGTTPWDEAEQEGSLHPYRAGK